MRNLDIDSRFTNIPLDEILEISPKVLFKSSNIVHGLKKSEFIDLLSLATKESHFIFNNILYKQIDRVVMGPPLGPSLANAFLAHHEQNWADNCRLEYKPSYNRRYVDDIFILFKSSYHLKRFQSHLNSCHVNRTTK